MECHWKSWWIKAVDEISPAAPELTKAAAKEGEEAEEAGQSQQLDPEGEAEYELLHSEVVSREREQFREYHVVRSQGYTGEQCPNCGSMRVRHNGSCMVCEDCGSTTGCS